MSADRESRRFEATPARKARARAEGNVARSGELAGTAAFACAALAAIAALPAVTSAAAAAFADAAHRPDPLRPAPALLAVVAAAAVPACAAAVGATAVTLVQAGGLRFVAPVARWNRLDPLAGLRRMIGAEALVGAARAVLAFLVTLATLAGPARDAAARAAALSSPAAFGVLVVEAAQRAFLGAVVVGVAFGAADYALVRRRWLRDLKMTFEELKRDQKDHDGDPQARARRAQLRRSFVRGSIQRTREAAFVVVNPAHIAIAIAYDPPRVAVPRIVVRAAGDAAAAVRRLAAAAGVPIVENVPLARALYAQGEAGSAIPAETFVAVAYVIAALARDGVTA